MALSIPSGRLSHRLVHHGLGSYHRRFIAGVTDVLRKFGLLGNGDERVPHVAEWRKSANSELVTVQIEPNL